MSTDAAATLTLRIDTGQAKADLELLKKEYGDLLAVMRAPATGKGVEGLGADAKLAAQQIETLTKQVATLQAKMATTSSGAKQAATAMMSLAEATKANISAAQASSNAAQARILKERAEAATLAAEAEARLAQVSAASISAAQASNNAAQARILKERAEAATLAAEAELRLAAATRTNTSAAQAAYAANQQRLAQARAAQPAQTYNALMNTTSVATPAVAALPRELEASHRSLSNATKESAAAQIHWNKVANEGHAAARGLAGALGTLWVTYGSLVPLLAGATIGSAFINAAKAGSEFAYQLTFVKALGGESAEAIQRLSDSALSLSQTGLRGPTEIASGFRILAQAGLDATAALEVMPQVLNLATVGEMEMEQAATTLVGVMTAFNLTVADAEHVGDVFAKAAALSQTSVQSMTEAMKYASVVGEQYGASLEDSAAALTLLAKVNIVGTAAGTAYRNMLKELYTPVPQAAAAMEKLGLKTSDAQGKLKSFVDIIAELRILLKDFNPADSLSITQRLFGERGGKEASRMLAIEQEDWNKLVNTLKTSKGFMEGVATELENTAKGKWSQAINTMKVQLVTAFNEMEPIFSQLADNLKALFADPAFLQNLKAIVGGMASLTNAVIEMAPHLITLAQAWVVYKAGMITAAVWTATSTAVMGFATSMQIASGIMGPALGPMASMKAIVAGLPALLMAIPTPLTIIAGGLAAGAVAWTIWGNNASRAGDKAYDAAIRAQSALDKVSRREKYGVGDLGEAQEELDKAEKLLRLRVEGRATGTALSDARESVAKWGKVVEGLEREKYKALNASEGLRTAVAGETKKPTRKASEVLGSEGRGSGGSARSAANAAARDERSILNSQMESALRQERIQLGTRLIEVETELADQTISATVATQRKNEATTESLKTEGLLLEKSMEAARAANDKAQIEKVQGQIDENKLKLLRQTEQATLDNTRVNTASRNSVEDLATASSRYVEDLALERVALDMTAAEVADLRIERERLRAVEDLGVRVDRKQVEPAVAEAEAAAIAARAEAQKREEEFQRSFVGGWKKAYKKWADNASSEYQRAADTFDAVTRGMDSALDEFVRTGKISFSNLAKSIIADIAMIEARALIAKATSSLGAMLSGGGGLGGIIGGLVQGVAGMFGGGAGIGGNLSAALNGFEGLDHSGYAAVADMIDSAKGNVFSGSPSLHAYANTVQTSPKTFAFQNLHGFARGGVFAEAGPEAVMPLKRDSAGRLGVQSNGSDKVTHITINLWGYSGNAEDLRRSAGQIARQVGTAVSGVRKYA